MGWCYLELEDFDSAIVEFKKAMGIPASHCQALSGLGETYRYMRKFKDAEDYYRKYLKECPGGPDTNVALSNLGGGDK